MVYGAINEKGENWYTHLGKVFDAIKNKQIDYNWLITDIDCFSQRIYKYCGDNDYCWLTGEELTQIIHEEDFQWIWAVLSGFDKSIPLAEILKYPQPYVIDYEGFWSNPISIQHPLATIEIVPWDSALTLFFSTQKELVEDFLKFFPYSEDLSLYNAK